ncbi:hypothetical protein [Saccharothrix xinjiangensis]|uniref:Ig-like domain-containing protein n=1 Tax=Saccharothrix xinjiangensis TaxID=204798 RepID=A0ABV9Y3F6_9PSEU
MTTPDPNATAAFVMPIDGPKQPATAYFVTDDGYVDRWFQDNHGTITKTSSHYHPYPPRPDVIEELWVDFANHKLAGVCAAYNRAAHPQFIVDSTTVIYPDPNLPILRTSTIQWFDSGGSVSENPRTQALTAEFPALKDLAGPQLAVTAAADTPVPNTTILFSGDTYRCAISHSPQIGDPQTLTDGGGSTFTVHCAFLGADNVIRVSDGTTWRTCTITGTGTKQTLTVTPYPPWSTS